MRWLFVKGRLKPGVSAQAAHANIALLGQQLAAAHAQTNKTQQMSAVPTNEVACWSRRRAACSLGAAGLMGVVGLVLLIACANVAGMLLARAAARRREISVRLAIGASRGRLVRQLLVEGGVLGLLGATAAVGCAWLVIRALTTIELPLPVQLVLDIELDWRVLTFAVIAAASSGMLASLPASRPRRQARRRPARRGPAGRVGRRRVALRDALVVTQVAFTAVLLVVAGLLRSLGESQRADVGFRPDGLAVLSFDTDMVRRARNAATGLGAGRGRATAAPGERGGHGHAACRSSSTSTTRSCCSTPT